MVKLIIGLFIGLGMGATAGYFYTENIYKDKLKTVESEKESKSLELTSCQEQKSKLEKQFQDADAELKLNMDRSCFVTSALLKAPEFIPPDLEILHSNNSGDIILNWTPVKGAKKYIVRVEAENGTVVNTTEVEGEPTLYLNRITNASKLDSAKYLVSVTAVNGLDQEGTQSERKPIQFSSQTLKAKPSKTAAKLKAKVDVKLKGKAKESSNLKKKLQHK